MAQLRDREAGEDCLRPSAKGFPRPSTGISRRPFRRPRPTARRTTLSSRARRQTDGEPVITKLNGLGQVARIPARALGFGWETYRSTGVRYLWKRLQEDARLARLGEHRWDVLYRTTIWGSAAEQLDAEVVDLSRGFLEIRNGSARTRVRQQTTMLDDWVTLQLALDRMLVHRLVSSEGLPVPEHLVFDHGDRSRALRFVLDGEGPCVVKPANDTGGGKGITTGVTRSHDLERAAARASRLSSRLIIERQSPGFMHRLLYLDGELLDVVRCLPPRVTGDGRSTIRELIAAENLRRLQLPGERTVILKADLDSLLTLEKAGLSLRTVPRDGEAVQVKTVSNQRGVDDTQTVRGPLSEELVAAGAEAARIVGLRLAGIDVVTPDPTRPLQEVGGTIIEVNGTPALHHHYLVANRADATPVAVPILRKLLAG